MDVTSGTIPALPKACFTVESEMVEGMAVADEVEAEPSGVAVVPAGPSRKKVPAIGSPKPTEDAKVEMLKFSKELFG